jgi:hypothetical protein
MWTFLVVVIVGVTAIVRAPSRSEGVMVPLLLLQLFAASSGFEVPARRGHYDLLLTSGHRRIWMALFHWMASVAAGAVAWLTLAAVEAAVSGGVSRLLTSGTIVAMGLVSTLPWALTVRLPRFSGGIGWLLALAISTSVLSSGELPPGNPARDVGQWLWSAWAFLVYPVGLVGHELSIDEALIATPALLVTLVAMAAACRWISRASVPLEAAQ